MGNQTEIIQTLFKHGECTKLFLYQNSTYSYYHNWEKHFGGVLSRLVKNGTIERVKRGVYRLAKTNTIEVPENPNQIKLEI